KTRTKLRIRRKHWYERLFYTRRSNPVAITQVQQGTRPAPAGTVGWWLVIIGKMLRSLVSCPRNTRYFAGGQLAVFQGASEAPISESYGSSEQRGKTANWPRPRGLRGKLACGCVVRRSRIGSDMLSP